MLSNQQLHVILELIQRQTAVFSATTLGGDYLSDGEKQILKDNGIDYTKLYDESKDLVELNFHLGLLSKILSEKQVHNITFNQLKDYVTSSAYIPLNAREKATINSIKMQSMSDIRSVNERIFKDVNNVVSNQFGNARANQEEYLRDQIATGTGDRKSRKEIARQIGRLTGDWSRDFRKSVEYISHTALNEGRAAMVLRKHDGDNEKAKVWFRVQPGACSSCVKLYLTNGEGSEPRIFTLKQLEANGSNIGRKQKEWKATLSALHPHSLTEGKTLVLTDNGWKQIRKIEVGEYVLTHKGRFRKVLSVINGFKVTTDYPTRIFYEIKYKLKNKDHYDKEVYSLNLTPEHKVLTNLGWIEVQNLDINIHKLQKLMAPCSCGCGRYVDYIQSGNKCFSVECKAKISAENAKKLDTPERNEKLSKKQKIKWEQGKYENVLKYLQSPEHRERNRKRMLDGGSLHAMKVASSSRTSKVQLKLFKKVKEIYEDAELEYQIFGKSLDIAIPSLKVNIEYDGGLWHNRPKNIIADNNRDELLKSNGWHVVRYRDSLPGYERIKRDVELVANNSLGNYKFVDLEIDSIHIKKLRTWSKRGSKLYDIQVEEDESFVARGIVIHNCRCVATEYKEGSVWNGASFEADKDKPKTSNRPKVLVTFNGQEFWV